MTRKPPASETDAPHIGVTTEDFCRIMGSFPTGVAVVTTESEGALYGMTISSLTSVSLEPLILLVCLAQGSTTADAVVRRGWFVVNLLRADQEHVSRQFVSKPPDRFQGIPITRRDDGLPVIRDTLGHVICQVSSIKSVGDHLVIFGRVAACDIQDGLPLLYYRRRYCRLAEDGPSAPV